MTTPLTDRERQVLGAVIETYVQTAEPSASRTIAKRRGLGTSPATMRNTMSDLEEKGYLYHPHTSAGRIPTDLAYRAYVDSLMRLPPAPVSPSEASQIREQLTSERTAVDQILYRAAQVLGLLTRELGMAVSPSLDEAVLERLELLQISADRLLLVLTVKSGVVRSSAQRLAAQPKFATAERLQGLMAMTERLDVLRQALAERLGEGLTITIGSEHHDPRLSSFTLVTSPYRSGPLAGVIGVLGPTRMPYDKIVALVDHTSRLVSELLQ